MARRQTGYSEAKIREVFEERRVIGGRWGRGLRAGGEGADGGSDGGLAEDTPFLECAGDGALGVVGRADVDMVSSAKERTRMERTSHSYSKLDADRTRMDAILLIDSDRPVAKSDH